MAKTTNIKHKLVSIVIDNIERLGDRKLIERWKNIVVEVTINDENSFEITKRLNNIESSSKKRNDRRSSNKSQKPQFNHFPQEHISDFPNYLFFSSNQEESNSSRYKQQIYHEDMCSKNIQNEYISQSEKLDYFQFNEFNHIFNNNTNPNNNISQFSNTQQPQEFFNNQCFYPQITQQQPQNQPRYHSQRGDNTDQRSKFMGLNKFKFEGDDSYH